MSSLALNKYSTLANIMEKESGDRSYPIWLLVNPNNLDVCHDLWAPILDEIQDKIYRKFHTRIDPENIFIKNTVSDIGIVPKTSNSWAAEVAKEIVMLRESVLEHQPKILITFGALTYEFVKRVLETRSEEGPKYWSTTNLGDEFERSMADFDINQTNRIPIPLLRRVMKKGKSVEDRNYSSWEESEKYLRYVGAKIADRIIENKESIKI